MPVLRRAGTAADRAYDDTTVEYDLGDTSEAGRSQKTYARLSQQRVQEFRERLRVVLQEYVPGAHIYDYQSEATTYRIEVEFGYLAVDQRYVDAMQNEFKYARLQRSGTRDIWRVPYVTKSHELAAKCCISLMGFVFSMAILMVFFSDRIIAFVFPPTEV